MDKAKSVLFFILLFLIISELVQCNNYEKLIKNLSNDQQLNNKNLITSLDNVNNNEYSERYRYGAESLYSPRNKRTPKKPESIATIQKRLKEGKFQGAEIMTADGQQKLEPNLTGPRLDKPLYVGIKKEQSYNKNNDRMTMLKAYSQADRAENFIAPGCECNFDKPCSWKWNTNDEFIVTSSAFYKQHKIGPKTDPFGNLDGKFLFHKT